MTKKPKKPIVFTENEIFAAMDTVSEMVGPEVLASPPKGYFSVRQYASHISRSRERATTVLRDLVDKGKLERVLVRDGIFRPAWFYGLPKTTKK